MSQSAHTSRKRDLLRFIFRILIIWGIEVAAVLLLTWLLPGVWVDSVPTAVVAVAVMGVVNALLWPILSYLLLPFAVLTFGLFALVLNAFLVLLASDLVEGFHVAGYLEAILLVLGVTGINSILSSLLTIDDENSWYRNVVQRAIRGRKKVETKVPGVLFLEIDGLAKRVFERAIEEGYMPTLTRWLKSGSHQLIGWETDLSSQTCAGQAGILHGSNENIPGFRWWDRARKRIVSTTDLKEVVKMEKQHSDGNGLLANDGASRANLFSGDAPTVMMTASALTDSSRFHTTDYYAYFANPYDFSRTLLLALWDICLETWQYWRAKRNKVYPILGREKRGGTYPLLRALTTVIMRELNTYTLIGDMFAGVPSVYATFVGYDEVAHHSGVQSRGAFDILRKLDHQFARLERVARHAPRPYRFVILSDHGQSSGATFKQRYGKTLEQFVQQLVSEKYRVGGSVDVHEDWKHANVLLTQTLLHGREAVSRPLGRALKGRMTDEGLAILGPEYEEQRGQPEAAEAELDEEPAEIVVLATGNSGLVYATESDEQATMEGIEEFYPGLLEGLVEHEGVGFIMVHSERHGPVVIGARGRNYLAEDRVEGENPLAGFGANAATHLQRTDTFRNAPDILVNSFYDSKTDEVAAFEELIGSHGGLGGNQTQPYLLYPAGWEIGREEIVGVAALHRVLKGWVSEFASETGSAETGGHPSSPPS